MKKIIIPIFFIAVLVTNMFIPERSSSEPNTISLELVQARADENSEEENPDPLIWVYPNSEPPSSGLFGFIKDLGEKYF
nr:hypothetical protein [uncultured Draconibacterium sp.]